MRYAWRFEDERMRFPAALRPLVGPGMSWFRRWDRKTAERVTQFVANSTYVAGQIRDFYGRDSLVVHPPVDTDFFTPGGRGQREDFLYVGRLVSYKRADLVVETLAVFRTRVAVVGDGHLRAGLQARATPNVRFLGNVGGEQFRSLYRSARALVYPAEEDFGIAMAEAQACGTTVISVARGGALDIVAPGETGWLLAEPERPRRRSRRQGGGGVAAQFDEDPPPGGALLRRGVPTSGAPRRRGRRPYLRAPRSTATCSSSQRPTSSTGCGDPARSTASCAAPSSSRRSAASTIPAGDGWNRDRAGQENSAASASPPRFDAGAEAAGRQPLDESMRRGAGLLPGGRDDADISCGEKPKLGVAADEAVVPPPRRARGRLDVRLHRPAPRDVHLIPRVG